MAGVEHPQGDDQMTDFTAAEKLYLTWRLRERLLTDHGGWRGVARWLYAWTRRPDGTRVDTLTPDETLHGYITEDANHWHELRRQGNA